MTGNEEAMLAGIERLPREQRIRLIRSILGISEPVGEAE